jgi:hypothetical protein
MSDPIRRRRLPVFTALLVVEIALACFAAGWSIGGFFR